MIGGRKMAKEYCVEDILMEMQEAEKLVIVGPGQEEVSLSSECGGIFSLACC